MTPAGAPAVRTSNTALPTRVCGYGTYIVGGAASRTLSYFASRSTPTISSWPLVSTLEPKRRPIGFSFGKYLRDGGLVDHDHLRRRRVVALA